MGRTLKVKCRCGVFSELRIFVAVYGAEKPKLPSSSTVRTLIGRAAGKPLPPADVQKACLCSVNKFSNFCERVRRPQVQMI
jgi:hypothetical protein